MISGVKTLREKLNNVVTRSLTERVLASGEVGFSRVPLLRGSHA